MRWTFQRTASLVSPRPLQGDFVLSSTVRLSRSARRALGTGDRRRQEISGAGPFGGLADTALQPNRAGSQQPQRIGVDAMLDLEDALGKSFRRIVIADGDCALHQDRTGVGFGSDEMHGGARNLDPGAQRL